MPLPLVLLASLLAAPRSGLRCEWLLSGATVADPCPEIAWLADDQAACRVRVASSEAALEAPDLWDSGWLETSLSVVEYAGQPLDAGRAVHYPVDVRDVAGVVTTLDPAEGGRGGGVGRAVTG
jgi:hypothetical protein